MPILTIILPCYNEEDVLPQTIPILLNILNKMIDTQKIDEKSSILCVDDGSKDDTWSIINSFHENNYHVNGLEFSRNFGHQNALIAGLTVANSKSDLLITIDADLQDDENTIPQMVEKAKSADVVYGVRSNRDSDTFFKKFSANTFYHLMSSLGVDLIPNSADFRLMSSRAVTEFLKYDERNMFIRGVVPLLGFPSDEVFYSRKEREAGVTKYPLHKMIHFALDGITSFSITPIRLIMNSGLFVVVIAIGLFIYSLVQHFLGNTTAGWSSLMTSIWFLGGVQLISISIIGEYIGKIFTEVKHRPRFTIETDQFSTRK